MIFRSKSKIVKTRHDTFIINRGIALLCRKKEREDMKKEDARQAPLGAGLCRAGFTGLARLLF
ncbi:MAG: hypothetical protein VR65_20785 [Desulfobulbaceae bacterium BRH_c16a]|nr:MAG: hypothetical protein VR65_20785 [Desulfobulbaceae bacterium BRH_c16a]